MWEAEHAGAEIAGQETGFHIYWNAPPRADAIEGQIRLVDRVIQDGTAGLVLVPDHRLALINPVLRALDRGVPVVIVASPLAIPAGEKGISYVLNDDQESGRMAARRIGKLLHGTGSVAVLGIDADTASTLIQLQAFEETLDAEFPGIAIVERRSGSFNSAGAVQAASDTLDSHPVDAILALTDVALRGAADALRQHPQFNRVKLVGCRQDLELMWAIRSGRIDSIVVQNTYEMGYRAVRMIAAKRQGQVTPTVVRLKPILATRDNLDSPELQQAFRQWRPQP